MQAAPTEGAIEAEAAVADLAAEEAEAHTGGSSEPKPVAVGDEIEVKIEAIASKGDGIAKKDGFVIFIKGAHRRADRKGQNNRSQGKICGWRNNNGLKRLLFFSISFLFLFVFQGFSVSAAISIQKEEDKPSAACLIKEGTLLLSKAL